MKKVDWYSIRQKVLTAVMVFIAIGFLGLVYTTYTQAQETPARVDSLETRMDTAETRIARLDTVMTDISRKMQADSTTQQAILKGMGELLAIAKGEDEN